MRVICSIVFLSVGLIAFTEVSADDKTLDAPTIEFFEKRIRPLLSDRCFSCHGDEQVESELRLDSRADMLEGGSRGAAVVPGEPDKSLLIRAVNHADTLAMPPKEKLSQRDIQDLTEWVKRGAPWPGDNIAKPVSKKPASKSGDKPMEFTAEQKQSWAFQPVKNVQPPRVSDRGWGQSPIDRFIWSELAAKNLQPNRLADKRTLIRRATFDLHGVPPTADEVAEFLADEEPDAFARLIDRLLASPRYGERWGRHWLDVARYGDSNGLDENLAHANAFRYRDWVIDALNRDLPYDQFVQQQIAGDLLSPVGDPNDPAVAAEQSSRLTATGFMVIGAKMLAEDDPLKMQMDIVDEQVDTIGKAFLGMTLGCARCHDHKFDPISQADYYSLAGIFKSTKTMNNFGVVAQWHERPLASPAVLQQIAEQKLRIAAKQNEINQLVATANDAVLNEARAHVADYVRAAAREIYLGLTERSFGTEFDRRTDKTTPLPDGVQIVEAENYQRGSALKLSTGYGEGIGVILSNGNGEWSAEYDITVPAAGPYQIETRYAAAGSRPTRLSLNGAVIKPDAFKEVTGSWNPDTQSWHIEGSFDFKAGINVLRLYRHEPLPHIDKLLVARRDQNLPSPDVSASSKPTSETPLHPAFVSQWNQFLLRTANDSDTLFPEWRALLRELRELNATAAIEPARQLFVLAERTGKQLADIQNGPLHKLLRETKDGAPFAIPKNAEEYFTAETKTALKQHRDEVKQLEAALPKLPDVMAVSEGSIEDLPIHLRGNHTTLAKDKQPRRFPRIFSGIASDTIANDRSGRLEFAHWLTKSDHPLTARVAVNRAWLWHFGQALVRSPDNFGLLGDKPTHPELLDWLAGELAGRGIENSPLATHNSPLFWSLKRLHREIMLSSTYQQTTTFNEAAFLADPDNRLWWRRNRRRLEVEAIRDSLLAVSGKLENSMGGTLLPSANRAYVTSTANNFPNIYNTHRRSVYLPVIRSALYELYQVFDFAEPSVMNGQRDSTTIAPQALFALNSSLVAEQSSELASRVLSMPVIDNSYRVREAYRTTLQREPSAAELALAQDFIRRFADASDPKLSATDRQQIAWRGFCRGLLASNEFLFVE